LVRPLLFDSAWIIMVRHHTSLLCFAPFPFSFVEESLGLAECALDRPLACPPFLHPQRPSTTRWALQASSNPKESESGDSMNEGAWKMKQMDEEEEAAAVMTSYGPIKSRAEASGKPPRSRRKTNSPLGNTSSPNGTLLPSLYNHTSPLHNIPSLPVCLHPPEDLDCWR